jgi:hypothetical protein
VTSPAIFSADDETTIVTGRCCDACQPNQCGDVSAYKRPILVRQRTTPLTPEQRQAFTVAANQPTTLAMSALLINPDDLSKNHDFICNFVAQLPPTERGAMVDAKGQLSSEGQRACAMLCWSRHMATGAF